MDLGTVATLTRVPYFICPNCKHRSIDHDGLQEIDNVPVACERCGFGFLFELMDDYYPAPNTGFVVCDQRGPDPRERPRRVRALRLPGAGAARRGRRRPVRAGAASRTSRIRRRSRSSGACGGSERSSSYARARASEKPVIADFFPAYDDDGGLLVALTPRG